MNVAGFSVRQPLLVNLFAIVVVATAAVVLDDINRESYPIVRTGWATVVTRFPGASPEEVERLVTAPVEDVVADVDGVALVASYSSEGLSRILVQFDPALDDVTGPLATIASEVARMRELPSQAESPIVRERIVRFVTLSVALRTDVEGERGTAMLQAAARHFERSLRRVDGVAEVETIGTATRQLRIDVDPTRLRNASLSLGQVARVVVDRSNNLSAGIVDDGERARIVRGTLAANNVDRLRDVVVRPDPAAGGAVRLRHVAEVSEGYPATGVAARVDGQRAIVLNIHREGGADSIQINEAVREAIERERSSLPDGVTVSAFRDASHEVSRTMDVLAQNAIFGLFLVFVTLFFFMGARNATMAALGLPVALAGGLVVMHAMGVTLNLLSLASLILCLGMVVDDAIVLIENIYRHIEEGKPRRQAAIDGTKEVIWPVVSATATTCAAFLPLLLMTGVLGEFFAIIPKVVVAVLVASLIEALFILPSHMAEFGAARAKRDKDVGDGRLARFGKRFSERYHVVLKWCLGHRKTTIGVAYLIFAVLVGLAAATKDVVLLTEGDVDVIDVRIRMPADASVHATDRVLDEVETRLEALRTDDVETISVTRGRSRNDFGLIEEDFVAMATISLIPLSQRSSNHAGRDLLTRASTEFDDIVGPLELTVLEYEFGPPVGAPVSIRLAGDDAERVGALAEEVRQELEGLPGVRNIQNSASADKRELQVEVDEGRAALHGLTPARIHTWLRLAFAEAPIASTLERNEHVDIVLTLDANAHGVDEMSALTLMTPEGGEVTLGDVATVREGRLPTHIRRNDRRRGVHVTAQVDGTTTSQAANRALAERLEPLIAANPDIAIMQRGEYEETNNSIRSLILAFILAIGVIYSILAAQFRSVLQPLVILSAIPLSLIGVAIGFFVTGAPVGLIALIGVVGLIGIVVNDSLVLVDFINQRRRQGMAIDDAIVAACRLRLRPIVATSVTTVLGILPLALSGADAPMLSPMASAIAWGLTASTLLTLLVVPCLYGVTDGFAEAAERRLGPLWRRVRGVEDELVES